MKHISRAILSLGVLLAVSTAAFASGDSESGGWVSGSGHVVTESRDVPAFTAIQLEGSGNVTIRQGPPRSVSVETDDNILPFVKIEVVGDVLYLGFKPGTVISRMTRLEFTVAAPVISGITVAGSGNARTAALLRAETLSLDVRGSGSIDCDVDARALQAAIDGSGGIAARGGAARLGVTVNGSGSMRGRDLKCAFADVRVNGSGGASVFATNTVRIAIAGSGTVEYDGGAKANVSSTGSGSVRQY